MLSLRPYQERDIERLRDALREFDRILYVAPTGSGKGVLITWMVGSAVRRRKRVCIGVHRAELVDDLSGRLSAADIRHSVLTAGSKLTSAPVMVASIPTLARRLSTWRDCFDFLLIDEGHHCLPDNQWGRAIEAFPSAKLVSFTASPERVDGRGLGDVFQTMVVGPSVRELIAERFLADFQAFVPAKGGPDLSGVRTKMGDYDIAGLEAAMVSSQLTGDAVAHYRDHLAGAPAITFCVSVRHAEMVAAEFRRAGYRAVSVDGTLDRDERRRRIGGLANGSVQVLTSCSLISEGLDIPAVQGAILLRPTQSLALMIQQVGRALRPKPDGSKAIILDHAGCCHQHGLPDTPRDWSLWSGKRAKSEGHVRSLRTCSKCFALAEAHKLVCPACGAAYPIQYRKPPKKVEGKLVVADRDAPPPEKKELTKEQLAEATKNCVSLKDFHIVARKLGYRAGWAYGAWQRSLRKRGPVDKKTLDRELGARLTSARS